MRSRELLLGMDGGGTKTVAWLAVPQAAGPPRVVGRGAAGPANLHAVGAPAALANLDEAVSAAFADAGLPRVPVASAVLGLAGADRAADREVFCQWADRRGLADRFQVVHDALPVLAAGSPEGWGVALISGTGSFAFGQDRRGRTARAGGWGHLFGDEGSGYAIALAGLRAATQAADGRGPKTELLPALLEQLSLHRPEELIPALCRPAPDRQRIGSLARAVLAAAGRGDPVAEKIAAQAAEELARMVAAVARKLDLTPFPLALAGGVLLANPQMAQRLADCLRRLGLRPDPIQPVADPVRGAVRLATQPAIGS